MIIVIMTRLAAGLPNRERGLMASGPCKCDSARPCSEGLMVRGTPSTQRGWDGQGVRRLWMLVPCFLWCGCAAKRGEIGKVEEKRKGKEAIKKGTSKARLKS